MVDKYKTKDLEGQLLNDMKRRAAFIAKCKRETAKIGASDRLAARIISQYSKLCIAIGVATTPPNTWTQTIADTVAHNNDPAKIALAIENTPYTEAQFKDAHSKAATAFTGYAAKLNWTAPV